MNVKDLFTKAYAEGRIYGQLSRKEFFTLFEKSGEPKKVLELGTGRGELAEQLIGMGSEVTCVDLISVYPKTIVSDITEFLLKDKEFYDAVFIKYTLAFLEDKEGVLNLCKNRLKEGGSIVIITPIGSDKKSIEEKELYGLTGSNFDKVPIESDSLVFAYILKK